MKIKWMAIAISLVFTLSFLAAPSWAGRNDRDGRKQGTHVEKPHKPGHPNRHGDSIYSDKHPGGHHSQFGLRSIYAKQHRYHKRVQKHHREYHRYDCYPRQNRTFFGISIYDPWGDSAFRPAEYGKSMYRGRKTSALQTTGLIRPPRRPADVRRAR